MCAASALAQCVDRFAKRLHCDCQFSLRHFTDTFLFIRLTQSCQTQTRSSIFLLPSQSFALLCCSQIMTLTFYYDVLSQPSRSVLLFIKANNIAVEEKPISIMKGTLDSILPTNFHSQFCRRAKIGRIQKSQPVRKGACH